MTIKELKEIIAQLKLETNPKNEKLLAYYEKKLNHTLSQIVNDAFKN